MLLLYAVLIVLFCYWFYAKFIKVLSYWKDRNVPSTESYLFFGGMYKLLMRKESFYDFILRLYSKHESSRYYGTFQFTNRVLVIRDLDLIKKICVKDFDHFIDHSTGINNDVDPLLSKNLISLQGDKWRDMRATLSPSFTSSKMKAMFHLIDDCTKEFMSYFTKELNENRQNERIEIEMKDASSRFTNDVIASIAFGINCNSLIERDNDFFKMGQSMANFTPMTMLKLVIISMSKTLTNIFKLRAFPEISDFFEATVNETIKIREEKNIIRPDMIHLLMESRRGLLKYEDDGNNEDIGYANVSESNIGRDEKRMKTPINNIDIAAQAMLFFIAGFETVSNAFSFLTYEIAINVDVQEKLQCEIDEVLANNDDKLSYQALLNMKYLDMVICESLRMWPPAPALDRKCVKDYKIESVNDGESDLNVEVGVTVSIPLLGIHRDPIYFENPNKFDPERFSDDNKEFIKPYTYMPFGVGPRNCIGSRFALLELKIFIFRLLSKFNVVPVEKTTVPMVLTKKQFKLAPDNGFWIGLQLRK